MMNPLNSTCAIAALAFAFSTFTATAATFTVTNTNNSGPGSLRQALTDSNNTAGSDTIVFDAAVFSTPQTIQLANAIQIFPATGDTITITGPGANLLTIRGNGVGDGSGQIFNRVGISHALSLSGMTLTNAGFSAVTNDNAGPQSSLTVTNVNFVANGGPFGGGGISSSAALTVTACTFIDNVTSPSGGGSGSLGGGAIHSDTNDVTIPVIITGSTFTNNLAGSTFAGSGGAVNNRSGAMTITNSTFTNNRARNGGGAVANGQVLSISGSTISGNSTVGAGVHGGAISSATNGQLTIANSLLTGNSAQGHGGALYASFSGTTTSPTQLSPGTRRTPTALSSAAAEGCISVPTRA
jgi:predicted outer membrane repeat protein